jgi:hypothetical protein
MPTSVKKVRSSGSKKVSKKANKKVQWTGFEVGMHKDPAGNIRYRDENGNLHRDDGPAVIYWDGEQRWYKHGIRHREDGPQAIFPGRGSAWYQNDKLHRDDGPAFEYPSENRFEWYKHGVPFEPTAHDIAVWKMKKKE